MHRPYLPPLNILLNTAFDFSHAQWSVEDLGYEYKVSARHDGFVCKSAINKRAWSLLAHKGRELVLQAAIMTAASNLIDVTVAGEY